jgi:ATP-binding cassette subfamily B multidrug efflux pump
MRALIKNLAPYKLTVLILVLLLAVQAYADISLPAYTSDIIDVGIQDAGIEHILPQKTTREEYRAAQIFMSDDEKDEWRGAYRKSGKYYVLKEKDEEKLDKLDDDLLEPIVMTYQLGHMSVKEFKSLIKKQLRKDPRTAAAAASIDDMSVDEIGKLIGRDVDTFRAEDESGKKSTYVDMRPLITDMISSGAMSESDIEKYRDKLSDKIDEVGSQTLKSMGISYAKSCDEKAGIDVDSVQKQYLWSTGRKMFLMSLLMVAAAGLVSLIASRVGAEIGMTLRNKVFRNVLSFSNAEIDKFHTSSLITRATNDIQQVQMVTTMMLRMMLYAPVLAVWGIIKVAQTRANMSSVLVTGVIVIVSLVLILMRIALPKFRIMQKLVDKLNGVSREILTGLSVIRAFGREKTEEERFDRANVDLKNTQLFTNRVMTLIQPSMMMIMNVLVVVITWTAAHRIDAGTLQVGAMTAFITYSMMVVMSFMIITVMSIILPRAGVAAERIDEVIETPASIVDCDEPEETVRGDGTVEFRNVSFRYPGADADVISGINFTAKPGETTAIIGSTGSGKSTIVGLIPRFFDVTSGEILVDGQDIRKIRLKDLRDKIGYVQQKGVLFSGTISSNIRFGNEEASDEEVRDAASTAQASDFIKEKTDGFDSYIAQGGSNVSGGQKQRLAIARALAKKPEILIFDDSFSALDMKTDANLRRALAKKEKDTTKIIVAQRVGTILHAEQILVLDEGRIAGRGTHDELMKSCEIYRKIAESQLSKEDLEVQ